MPGVSYLVSMALLHTFKKAQARGTQLTLGIGSTKVLFRQRIRRQKRRNSHQFWPTLLMISLCVSVAQINHYDTGLKSVWERKARVRPTDAPPPQQHPFMTTKRGRGIKRPSGGPMAEANETDAELIMNFFATWPAEVAALLISFLPMQTLPSFAASCRACNEAVAHDEHWQERYLHRWQQPHLSRQRSSASCAAC